MLNALSIEAALEQARAVNTAQSNAHLAEADAQALAIQQANQAADRRHFAPLLLSYPDQDSGG